MKYRRVPSLGDGLNGLECEFFDEMWKLNRTAKPSELFNVKVPGNIRLALMEANQIPDPFLGDNNEYSKWVSDQVWEYTNTLDLRPWQNKILNKHTKGGFLHLNFGAIDYDASIFIENRKVCRQIGMFSPIDIIAGCSHLRKSSIATDISSVPIKLLFHVQPFWRQHAVKSQMAFGWDFAPEIRTIGIWKHVRLFHTGSVFFTEIYVLAEPNKEIVESSGPFNVNLFVNATIKSIDIHTLEEEEEEQMVILKINMQGSPNEPREIPIKFKSGIPLRVNLGPANIPLWYPWSIGNPTMTPIQIELFSGGELSDRFCGNIVNRQIEWVKNPGTLRDHEKWTLKVNGTKMFLRGMNWVPPDSFYGRLDSNRYKKLIDYAKSMHVDMLRVWGGGIEEKKDFYDYCDQVGMMVWQEFPFACTNYPSDPKYLEIVKSECEGIVERTRRHPSVINYCGGNEFNPIINQHIVNVVRQAVQKYAPDRFCFAASPLRGDDHNWRFWGMRRKFEAFEVDSGPPFQMLTEYGMQASPDLFTLTQCLGTASLNSTELSTDQKILLQYHKADLDGLNDYAQMYCNEIKDLRSLIHISQTLQAYALKYAIEVCRAAWPNVSGVFPWQLSDPWPNVSWSIVDHNYHPKLAYYMLQISYAPVLPMVRNWRKTNKGTHKIKSSKKKRHHRKWGDIVVHNSTQSPFIGKLQVIYSETHSTRNSEHSSQSYVLTIPQNTAVKVGNIMVTDTPGNILHLTLFTQEGIQLVDNISFPAMEPIPPKYLRLYDRFDARFDGWWRKHMTKLMVLEKIREERPQWEKKKQAFLQSKLKKGCN